MQFTYNSLSYNVVLMYTLLGVATFDLRSKSTVKLIIKKQSDYFYRSVPIKFCFIRKVHNNMMVTCLTQSEHIHRYRMMKLKRISLRTQYILSDCQ